jgi:hypothetical protein
MAARVRRKSSRTAPRRDEAVPFDAAAHAVLSAHGHDARLLQALVGEPRRGDAISRQEIVSDEHVPPVTDPTVEVRFTDTNPPGNQNGHAI